ncbi:2Fe-2S iron-sulfur cluster-binding protein [Streptomyces sp. NPDC002537]
MSDEQQRHDRAAGQGGWQPIPRAEYDADGTTFLQLPPELLAHPGAAASGTGTWDPLAATGAGGYVPPTGEQWQQQPSAPAPAPVQNWGTHPTASHTTAPYEHTPAGRGPDPHATAEWAMPFASDTADHASQGQGQAQAQGQSHGHWTVPAAGDDPVDESGEYVLHGRTEPQGAAAHDHAGTPPQTADAHQQADASFAVRGGVAPHPGPHAPAVGTVGQAGAPDAAGEHVAHGHPGTPAGVPAAVPPAVPAPGTGAHQPAGDSGQFAIPAGAVTYAGQHAVAGHGTDGHRPVDASGEYAVRDGLHGAADPHSTAQWPVPAAAPHGHTVAPAPQAAAVDGPADDSGAYAVPGAAAPQTPVPQAPAPQWPSPGGGDTWEQPAASAAGSTGQWSVPVVPGEPADESGEYALSSFAAGAGPAPAADSTSSPGGSPQEDASFASVPSRPFGDAPHATGVTGTGDHPTGAWTPPAEPAAAPVPETPMPEAPVAGMPVAETPVPETLVPEVPVSGVPAAEAPVPSEAGTDAPTPAVAAAEPPSPEPEAPQDADPQQAEPAPVDPPAHADPVHPGPAPVDATHTEHPCASYVLRVNGTDRPVTDAWIGESLLYVLRERLGLAGAKDGCSQGECGACSVQVDGRLVASCLVPAATAAGAEVRTVEGLAADGRPSDVQRALAECGAVQCGFCVPGMAMTMHDLLEGNHAPTELETRQAICGNLCRCSGYRGVLDAVRQVADERAAAAAAQEEAQPEAEQARIPHQAGPHGSGKATA